jgi:hypothetical protein
MTDWKLCGRNLTDLMYLPGICLVGMKETAKNLGQEAGFRVEILTLDVLNTKQDYYAFEYVRSGK